MKQRELFTKTRKEAPKDEVSKNAQLLIRAGFIHKELAGVYSFLPLGLRVLNNVVSIIREEMNALGAEEVNLPSLQNPELWKKTNRWNDEDYDIWFKTNFKNGGETGLGSTHEEPLTNIMKEYISSYRDMPRAVYQFQTKFRNETRAKSGIMRGKEFLMKDMYSFCGTKEEHDVFYAKAREAYIKIFKRMGIGDITFPTFALGGTFSKFSEEFQTLSEAGEDVIYVHKDKKTTFNKEAFLPEILADMKLEEKDFTEHKSIEVGNIFNLGTKFSEPLELKFKDKDGTEKNVIMGCYGIGPSRLVGAIVEALSDDKGIVWPEPIAPFNVHLISMGTSDEVVNTSDKIYKDLISKGITVLHDDRDLRPGEKFADAELIGIPHQIIIGEKGIKEGVVEYKNRKNLGEVSKVSINEIIRKIVKK